MSKASNLKIYHNFDELIFALELWQKAVSKANMLDASKVPHKWKHITPEQAGPAASLTMQSTNQVDKS